MAGQSDFFRINSLNVIQFHAAIERNHNTFSFERKRGGFVQYGSGGNSRTIGNGNNYRNSDVWSDINSRNFRISINSGGHNAHRIDVSVATRQREYHRRNQRNVSISGCGRWANHYR